MPFVSKQSDADASVPSHHPGATKITLAQQRQAAALLQQGRAAINLEPPQPLIDEVTGRPSFLAVPIPLKQRFGAPLEPQGK
jgi:hypothetical protein